jgi:hypothetical protein
VPASVTSASASGPRDANAGRRLLRRCQFILHPLSVTASDPSLAYPARGLSPRRLETDRVAARPVATEVQLQRPLMAALHETLTLFLTDHRPRYPNGSALRARPPFTLAVVPTRRERPAGATRPPFTPRNPCEVSTKSDER